MQFCSRISYERVMPGRDYFRSIIDFWRVYAGSTPHAAEVCAAFLSKVIHVDRYPLTRLHSTTASETGKLLENSYRALNIAFIEEWGRFAEAVGVDLFEVIDAVRMRPTHSNMRQPGFGVGGYCLTKDPLLAGIAARDLFRRSDISFTFSQQAVGVNDRMPLRTLE
jgi:UDP-N-acetyl-D-glucosamine dehydrogenase